MANPAAVLQRRLRLSGCMTSTTAPSARTLLHRLILPQRQVMRNDHRPTAPLDTHTMLTIQRRRLGNLTVHGTPSAALSNGIIAAPKLPTEQYLSEAFVESVGAVICRLAAKQICIIYQLAEDWYVLAKGRRNLGETRQTAVLRELEEETGYVCRLLPVRLRARCPPAVEEQHTLDEVRTFENASEPFNLQIVKLSDTEVKLVWWYIASVDDSILSERRAAHEVAKSSVMWCDYTEALDRLTFQWDRDMVTRAIELVNGTYNTSPPRQGDVHGHSSAAGASARN